MPKRKGEETPEEQGARFIRDVQRMIDAGELSPTDAEKALDALVRKAKTPPHAD